MWEAAIKRSLCKLQAPDRFASTYLDAQARVEDAVIISSDEALRVYDVPLLW